MRRRSIGLTTLLICATAHAQTTRPATTRESESVKDVLRAMRLDAVRGDVQAVQKRIATNTPDAAQMAEPIARSFVAFEAAKAAVLDRFGPDELGGEPFGLPEPAAIDEMTVTFDAPDRVTLQDPTFVDDRPRLVRVGDAWLYDVTPEPDAANDPTSASGAIVTMAIARQIEVSLASFTPEAAAHDDTPIGWMRAQAGGVMVGGQRMPGDVETNELRKLQDGRAPLRAKDAARIEALRTPKPIAAAGAKLDRGDAAAVARAYVDAVAAGDVERAAALVDPRVVAKWPPAARGVAREAIGQHAVRAAAVRRIGKTDALRLSLNDSGTFFRDRQRVTIAGEKATLAWHDDLKTPDSPGGTERSVDLARVGGKWSIAFDDNGEPLTFAKLADAAMQGAAMAKSTADQVRRIDAGELKTFEQISGR